jgi:hypothetical protein
MMSFEDAVDEAMRRCLATLEAAGDVTIGNGSKRYTNSPRCVNVLNVRLVILPECVHRHSAPRARLQPPHQHQPQQTTTTKSIKASPPQSMHTHNHEPFSMLNSPMIVQSAIGNTAGYTAHQSMTAVGEWKWSRFTLLGVPASQFFSRFLAEELRTVIRPCVQFELQFAHLKLLLT